MYLFCKVINDKKYVCSFQTMHDCRRYRFFITIKIIEEELYFDVLLETLCNIDSKKHYINYSSLISIFSTIKLLMVKISAQS